MALLDYVSPSEFFAALSELSTRLEKAEASVSDLSDRISRLEPPPLPETITVNPGDDLQHIINTTDKEIVLSDGAYSPIIVKNGTRIRAANPGKAYISGLVRWSTGWERVMDTWVKPFTKPLYQHPAKRVHGTDENGNNASERGLAHRRAMQPHLLMFGNTQMLPVYNKADLSEGRFWLEGTSANPVAIHAMFPGDADPVDHSVTTSFSEFLLKGENEYVSDVALDGLTLIGCANTQTRGALHMPINSQRWTIGNVHVTMSSGEGVVLRGSGHQIGDLKSTGHGISAIAAYDLNNSVISVIEGSRSGFKPGLDILWHGGNKISNSANVLISKFLSLDMEAAGLWLDISNTDIVVDGFEVSNSRGFGVHIEHYTQGSEKHAASIQNGLIRRVRKHLGIGSGLQIQSNVKNYLFSNIDIEECEDGAVYYKKREVRGNSGFNTFQGITTVNNGNGNRWVVQGDMGNMPDEYLDMDLPAITNWN